MIESGEVGAVFRIVDEASPVLKRLMDQFDALQGVIDRTKLALSTLKFPPGLNASLGNLEKKFAAITDASKISGDAITSSFAKIDAATAATTANIANLGREMKAIGAESRIAGGASNLRYGGVGGGGGGRGGSHGGGPHITRPGGLPLGGGFHMSGGGMLPMAAGAALAYGVYQEAEVEDIAARALMTGQIKVDSGMRSTDAFKSIRDVIQRVASQTGFSPKEVGEAILTTERQFGGLSFKDRLGIEETLIPFAAAEARMKESTLPQAFEAMVGLAHMTGTYDTSKLPELMRQFAYASMITPVPIEQFQRAISYSLPMLHAGLDMDPSSIMFLTAMTQTAGITNTKSGTWLRSFFENAEPRMGSPLSKSAIAHNQALERMGLLDSKDHVTWQVKDAAGKTDWDNSIVKMSEIINKFTSSTDPATRLSTLRTAFGERGGGFAALMNLEQFIGQFPVLQAKMKAFQGGENVLTSLTAGSPVQQARNAWSDMQNVMMDIGQSVLPPLTFALSGFDAALKGLHKTIGDTGANTVVGAGVLGTVAAYFARNRIGSLLGFGKGSVVPGAPAAAPTGELSWFAKMANVALPVATLAYENEIKTALINPLLAYIFGAPSGNKTLTDVRKDFWGAGGAFPVHAIGPGDQGWYPAQQAQSSLFRSGYRGSDLDRERGRESARGKASPDRIVQPPPILNFQANVRVTLDGKAIAAAVETDLVGDGFTHGHNSQDSHANYSAPDVSGSGHQ